jgi:flavodoxin
MKKPVIVLRLFNIFAVNWFIMKKTLFILAAVLCFSMTACSQGNNKKENNNMKKTLVVYFSATGTTKAAAQRLAQEFNADLYEITPEVPYTAADLDWRDKTSRSTIEMQDKTSRPAIKGRCENIADYDIVWIGFPVWWYTAPTIINTFIEAHDLSGKTLNVFATSGGSDVKDSYNDLKKAYPQYKWGESRLMN